MGNEQLGSPVSEPFEVKDRLPAIGLTLALTGIGGLLIGGFIVAMEPADHTMGLIICSVGLPLAILGAFWLKSRRRLWRITPYENGAEVQAKTGPDTKVVFAELAALSHQPKPRYANGIYTGIRHILRFWRKEDGVKMPFVHIDCCLKAKKGLAGPEAAAIQAFVDAASNAIAKRLAAVMDGGGTVKSPGGLQVSIAGVRYQGTSIAMDEIGHVGVAEGKICIWKRGEDFASLKLNPAHANVVPMMDVVARRLAERDEQAEAQGENLGRVLFERRRSKVLSWVVIVIGALLSIGIVGIPIILLGLSMLRGYFRCHERGVSQRRGRKERRLLYTQVATFTYSATRMYVNGIYAGTSLVMKFDTEDPKALPPIKFSASIMNVDQGLDELRDRISAVVAQRLLRTYADTGSVTWTKSLEIGPEGVRYRKPKLIGKGDWTDLPFSTCRGVSFEQGTFHLFAADVEKPVFGCPVSEPNLFPGIHALLAIAPSVGQTAIPAPIEEAQPGS